MNSYRDTKKDIHKRIYQFVLGCFQDIVKKIPKSVENIPVIQQVSASLTSMGANDQEADAAGSKRDFVAKFMIVRKETKETHYWLSFVRDAKLFPETQTIDRYINESHEILLIVSAIIKKLSS